VLDDAVAVQLTALCEALEDEEVEAPLEIVFGHAIPIRLGMVAA
jgi:hypothetical protein